MFNIKNLIIAGALATTIGCGPVDEVPNGVFNVTGPTGAECDVEVTNTSFVVNKDCLDLLGSEQPTVEVTTNNLPALTDRNSVQRITIGTMVQVTSDPNGDNEFHPFTDRGWVETSQGLTVFLDFKDDITQA